MTEDWNTSPEPDPSSSQPTRISPRRSAPAPDDLAATQPSDDSGPRGPEYVPHAPEAGQWLVNRYELRKRLGQGGMGMVWRAWDEELEREVAIKLLPPEITQDVRAQRQLKVEAQAAITLAHPNIVKVLSFRRAGAVQFLEMEYVNGPSLAEVLHQKGPLPETEVQRYLLDICSGLAEAHRRGIIHRDIKPANLLLDPDGTIKIADFGIARIVAESTTRATGQVASGTLLYMAPEQLLGKPCDARSDLYSLGVTAYELLAGEVPYSSGDITYQHLHEHPEPIFQTAPILWPVIERMLEKKPDARFQDAWSVADVLGGGGTGPRVAYRARQSDPSAAATFDAEKTKITGPATDSGVSTGRFAGRDAATVLEPGPPTPVPRAGTRPPPPAPRGSPWLWVLSGLGTVAALAILAVVFLIPPGVGLEQAAAAMKGAEYAKEAAMAVEAEQLAPDLWQEGLRALSLGTQLQDSGDFEAAVRHYGNAELHFDNAGQATVRVKGLRNQALAAQESMQAAREAAAALQAAQGATAAWDEAEQLRTAAEQALNERKWEDAQAAFSDADAGYVKAGERVKQTAQARTAADQARSAQATARTAAEQAAAARYAPDSWASAEELRAGAQRAFDAGNFASAQTDFRAAASAYETAKADADAAKANEQQWLAKVQAAQAGSSQAKKNAAAVNAASFAPGTWTAAERLFADATTRQEAGEFEVALNLFEDAGATYENAAREAEQNAANVEAEQLIATAEKNMRDEAAFAAGLKQEAANLNGPADAAILWAEATAAEATAKGIADAAARVRDAQSFANAAQFYTDAGNKYKEVVDKITSSRAAYTDAIGAIRTALDKGDLVAAGKNIAAAKRTMIQTPELQQLEQAYDQQKEQQRRYREAVSNARALAAQYPRQAYQALAKAEEAWPEQPEARALRDDLSQREDQYNREVQRARAALQRDDWRAALSATEQARTIWPPETTEVRGLRERAEDLRYRASRPEPEPEPDRPTKKKKGGGFDYLGDR